MCGICGLYSPSGEPQATLVNGMRARIRHRGPDQGSTDAFGSCVLGHQRLQVIDPKLGYQPVASESGTVVAVFNGELYNFPELREELAARGHEVRGRGDTPVLPHLYEEFGPRFVERLDGMFAIALWDAARQRLVLARDRLGKKPLVWTRLDDGTIATVLIAPEGSPAANYGFDVTPARLVTGFITERGVTPATRGGLTTLYPEHRKGQAA